MIYKKYYIFGLPVNKFNNYKHVYSALSNLVKSNVNSFVTVNNVHTLVEGVRKPKYREAINNSFLSLADGKPLSVYAKLKGHKDVSRIFGPTLFEKILDFGQTDGLKHYFFGSSQETLDRMIKRIRKVYSQAIISGYYSPLYKPTFTLEENKKFIEVMNSSGADIFWIGLGAPKQEMWMYENYKKLNKGIMIGIGAGFDYFAGNIKHAPEWMKNTSLEWLYRLIQEPKRLWKRYLITNSLFIFFTILELIGLKKFNSD